MAASAEANTTMRGAGMRRSGSSTRTYSMAAIAKVSATTKAVSTDVRLRVSKRRANTMSGQ